VSWPLDAKGGRKVRSMPIGGVRAVLAV